MAKRTSCSIDECDRSGRLMRGWCAYHYQRWYRYGDPLVGPSRATRKGEPQRWDENFLLDPGVGCRTDWPYATSQGYPVIVVKSAGPGGRRVARVVCEAVHGPPPPGAEVCHGPCHDAMCIQPSHLSWGSPLDNARDKRRDGTDPRGSRNGYSKLDESRVLEIVEALNRGVLQRDLAERYNVSPECISSISRGKRWQWLTGR